MHPFKVNGFTPVRSHIANLAGQTWCLLHEGHRFPDGSYAFPPEAASFIHGGLELRAVNTPVRWDLTSPWLPWTPKVDGDWKPWYLDPSIALPSDSLQRQWKTDIEGLQNCIDACRERYPQYRGPSPSRSAIDFSSHQKLQEAQQAMLERVCFVNWWITWMQDWRSSSDCVLKQSVQSKMESYLLEDRPKVGVVVELAKDWNTMNFPLWIHHGIPVYYQWNGDAELDPRFAHASPASLEANRPSDSRYDGFFQNMGMPLPNQPKRQNLPSKGHVVVDFEGWRCRSILEKRVANKYFNRLPFVIHAGNAGKFVVFSRWRAKRKHRSPYPDPESDDCESSDSEAEGPEDPNRIRETYRWQCAPHSGKKFDIETGKEIGSVHQDTMSMGPRQPSQSGFGQRKGDRHHVSFDLSGSDPHMQYDRYGTR